MCSHVINIAPIIVRLRICMGIEEKREKFTYSTYVYKRRLRWIENISFCFETMADIVVAIGDRTPTVQCKRVQGEIECRR